MRRILWNRHLDRVTLREDCDDDCVTRRCDAVSNEVDRRMKLRPDFRLLMMSSRRKNETKILVLNLILLRWKQTLIIVLIYYEITL